MVALAAVFAAAVVAAILELGAPATSARTTREVVTAATGVVQSTVTGTGNIEPTTDVQADFQTSGVLQSVYVKEGDHVVRGQLLATLDPTSAQLGVDQAEEQLTSAQDQLTNAENETTTSSTAAALAATRTTTAFVSYQPNQTPTPTGTTRTRSTPSTTTPTRSTSTTTTPSRTTTTTPARTTGGSGASNTAGGTSSTGSGTSAGSGTSGSGTTNGSNGSGGSSGGVSAATKASDIASAQASVDSAEASLTTAENTLHETHLYAPATGTVVSLSSASPGDQVSAGGSSSSSGGSGSSGSSGTSGSGSGGSTSAGGLGQSSTGTSSSSSSSSSSAGFVEVVNTGSMMVTVPFSESDIGQIKVGQAANVTLEALTGVELAGHVSAISTLGSSSSGVVSYDATITIDQHDGQVKPGMSTSVSVVTAQATGVNLPSSAVTGTAGSVSRVNLLQNGHAVSTPVVVGLVGTSRTQIVSGLRAGQQVVVTETLPALGTSTTSSGSASTGTLGGSGLGGSGGFPGGGSGFRRLGGGGGFLGGG